MENIEPGENPELKESLARVAGNEMLVNMSQAVKGNNRVIFILSVSLVIVSAIAAFGFYRHPKVIVAVQSADGQRIASIDDMKFGATEQIQMGEEKLTDRDKRELVENFLSTIYGVDLASRSKDVPKALNMMIPETGRALYKDLNERGTLQKERDEGWSAGWNTDSFEIDRTDKNTARVIGTQTLRRIIGGNAKKERVQYKIVLTLHTDGKRDETPLRTGYWIVNFKAEELSRTEEN